MRQAEEKQDYDLPLVGRYAVLGSTAFPVFLFYWYKFLDKALPGTAARTIVKKVIIDQFVTAPPILTVFYTGEPM
jgi:Mpv17-like protein